MTAGKILKAGVMGWPIEHSLSPRLHGYWLKKYNIKGSYEALAVKPENLAAELRALIKRQHCRLLIILIHLPNRSVQSIPLLCVMMEHWRGAIRTFMVLCKIFYRQNLNIKIVP
jgi:hypothetical protein